jgi:hypothetical protein
MLQENVADLKPDLQDRHKPVEPCDFCPYVMQDAKSEFLGRIGKIRAPIYLAQRMHLLNEAEYLLLERPDIVGFKGCWLAIGPFSCNCR